jgi:hypothetical protein
MLRVNTETIRAVATAVDPKDLYPHLQSAIELEHATIPLYFTAFLSIKPGFNQDIAAILRSVFVEEMLHMSIVCNILNAIEGTPVINKPEFIPKYPGHLPLDITNVTARLAPLSQSQIDVFMQIEEPEKPLQFPVKQSLTLESVPLFGTIGEFYQALIETLGDLGDRIFKGDPKFQVVNRQWFPESELFAIRNATLAKQALALIVEQGEGTSKSPLSDAGPAHYYRFAEIHNGRRLVKDPSDPLGFSYSGAPIGLDPAGVWNMVSDPKAAQYKPGSRARMLADQFNRTYTALLNSLHGTFNGYPATLDSAMGLMFELNIVGGQLVETVDEVTGRQAAPSFEYAP